MRGWLIAVVAGALALGAATPVRAGELGDLRSETQGSGGSSSGSGGSGGSSGSSSSDSSGGSSGSSSFGAALGEAMVEAYMETVRRLYTRYPYADGARGFVLIVDPEDDDPPGQRFSGTFTLDGAALSPSLGRAGVDLELMVRRFGLGLELSPHLEWRPPDALTLGSATMLLGLVLLPRWQVYGGIGANVMIDGRVQAREERVDAVGVVGTLRTTILPVRPVVVRARVDVGSLGAAPAALGRLTAGVILRRFEVFGGYEGRRVGDVVLHGPTVGTRVWF